MSIEENSAFLAAVADEPEIISQADRYSLAEEAVKILLAKAPQTNFVDVLQNTRFGDRLLDTVASHLRETDQWKKFVDDMLGSDNSLWPARKKETQSPFCFRNLIETLAQCAEPRDLMKHLIVGRNAVGLKMMQNLPNLTDSFWEAGFWRRVVRNDFRRAWETLKQAKTGIPIKGGHVCPISPELLGALITDLHDRMLRRKLIEGIEPAASYRIEAYESVQVYENTLPAEDRIGRHRKPNAYHKCRPVPGFDIALAFRVPSMNTAHIYVNEVGKMALKIARYFSDKRNAKRAKRYAKLLGQFERKTADKTN